MSRSVLASRSSELVAGCRFSGGLAQRNAAPRPSTRPSSSVISLNSGARAVPRSSLVVRAYQSLGSRGRFRGRGPPKPRGPPKNEDIRGKEVRVIGSQRENLGVMPTKEAVSLAQSEGLDLVLVTPDASPPVCRVVDFGKYMYEQEKKKKEAKKGQSKAKSSVKELKMRPNTDVHDYNVRLKRAKQFLAKGNKVKITVVFSGRDMAYKDKGRELLDRFRSDVEEDGHVDGRPSMQGRQMMMFLNPGPKKDKQ
mmetsp:Transcript_3471/g.12633  ORF Transcript_3471/g.12633 Transcript_3471/m.12633 type:complete len:252 (-) Transcript_3471:145-900(-)